MDSVARLQDAPEPLAQRAVANPARGYLALMAPCAQPSLQRSPLLSLLVLVDAAGEKVDQCGAVHRREVEMVTAVVAQRKQSIGRGCHRLHDMVPRVAPRTSAPSSPRFLASPERFGGGPLRVERAFRQKDDGLGIERNVEACRFDGYGPSVVPVVHHGDLVVCGHPLRRPSPSRHA